MGKIEYLFCATFHDPEFRLYDLIESALPKLKELFVKGIICLTPYTPDEVRSFLTKNGFLVKVEPDDRQIVTYKTAIRTTLENIDKPSSQRIFLIDFDRLIHWINTYPEELTNILQNNINVEYLHIGRTTRAFNTHPKTQKETEIIVNEFGSKILGFEDTKDLISVCYIFTKDLGEKILKINNFTKTGFYGSWPIYFWNFANTKSYIEVEGHEWETPDRFKKEIDENPQWLEQFQSAEEWNKRVNFLHDCLLEMSDCAKFEFKK